MKIVFFGTPDYVLPILTGVHKKFVTGPGKSPIVAVVTQSPKPMGRKQIKTYSPVDQWAHERKIPIFYQAEDIIKENVDADLGICAAFSQIIPKSVIDHFKFGILNIHPSLLPKYRGASPVQATIIAGDTQAGVSIIKMDEKVDHGPIVSQFKEDVLPNDTGETLRGKFFERSAEVLVELIEPYLQGKITPRPQDDAEATFTKTVKREDGFVDLQKDNPAMVERKLRAYTPWLGIWTSLPNGKRLKILPGGMVQLEGKNPVTRKQFADAYPQASLLS